MDPTQLAILMLQWELAKARLDAIEAALKDAVLQVGETQVVGNVRAKYDGGRKTYDYESAAEGVPEDIIDAHTTTTTKVNWRAVCKDAGIEDIPFTKSDPSVSISLTKRE